MSKLLKSIKSGNFELSIWENEKDFGDVGIVGYQTITIRKNWKDNNSVSRDQKLHLRKQDIERVLVLLRKAQEHLLLEGENEQTKGVNY